MSRSITDDAEFRKVYDAHHPSVARYCLRRLPEDEARDAVSETFLIAWRRQDAIPAGDDALLWLYGVARNVVRNSQRSQRRRIRVSARAASEPAYPVDSPEVQVVRNEQDSEILAALATLKPDDQEAIRLRAYEDLSLRQISLVLGCTEEAAKKRVSRALGRLRKAASISAPLTAGADPRATHQGGER